MVIASAARRVAAPTVPGAPRGRSWLALARGAVRGTLCGGGGCTRCSRIQADRDALINKDFLELRIAVLDRGHRDGADQRLVRSTSFISAVEQFPTPAQRLNVASA